MQSVTIHQAKTNLSSLIKRACEGEKIVISRGSQAVAKLVAIKGPSGERRPGSLEGTLVVGPEFFDPLPDDEMAEWE